MLPSSARALRTLALALVFFCWIALHSRAVSALGPVAFPEFVINQRVEFSQRFPAIAATPDGGSVVAWFHHRPADVDPEVNDLYLRRLGPDGTPLGPDRRLFAVPHPTSSELAITVDSTGRITLFWTEQKSGPPVVTYQVAAIQRSPSGGPLGPAITVFESTQLVQAVRAAATEEGIVVAWAQRGDKGRVAIGLTDSTGALTQPPSLLDDPEASSEGVQGLAVSRDGRVMLVTTKFWPSILASSSSVARLYEPGSLDPFSTRILIDNQFGTALPASVAAHGAHQFVVTWIQFVGFFYPSRLLGSIVRSDGEILVDRFLVSDTEDPDTPNAHWVASGINGQIVSIWEAVRPPGPGSGRDGLRYRVLDQAGAPLSPIEMLNGFDSSNEGGVQVVNTAPGHFLAVWQSGSAASCAQPCSLDGLDGHRAGIVGRRIESTTSRLQLQQGRFILTLRWIDLQGASRLATAQALTGDTGFFHFGNPDNVELVVKVLDGRAVNGHFWIFVGGLTNVEYELLVVDTQTLESRRYFSEQGRLASFADTRMFADEVPVVGDLPLGPSPILVPGLADICTAGKLCLNEERFEVTVNWLDPRTGKSGVGHPVKLTADTGYFWFFRDANVELTLKVLDGRPVNGRFWVFYAGLSDVQYSIEVRDTVTGEIKSYLNLAFDLASVADTAAF